MKTPTFISNASLLTYIAMLLAYTNAFSVNPSVADGHSLQMPSSTELFHQSGFFERPLKASKKKKHSMKTTATMYSIDEAKDSSVESLILLLNDPQIRHKVRRRPLLIPNVHSEKPKRKARRGFQEGQELARLAVQEVLREHNIDDVSA